MKLIKASVLNIIETVLAPYPRVLVASATYLCSCSFMNLHVPRCSSAMCALISTPPRLDVQTYTKLTQGRRSSGRAEG